MLLANELRLLSGNLLRAAASLPAEDSSVREQYVSPLENFIQEQPDMPRLDGLGGDVTRALWYKHHPEQADIAFLFQLGRNDRPVVRMLAADALAAAADKNLLTRAMLPRVLRETIKELQAAEASPVVQMQWDNLNQRLGQERDQRRRVALKSKGVRLRTSPYVAGIPVRGKSRFFGRQDLIARVRAAFEERGMKSVVLSGARRMGKTSILFSIEDGALGDGFFPIYLDMQSVAGEPMDDFLRAIALRIDERVAQNKPALARSLPKLASQPSVAPGEISDYIRKLAKELGTAAVLLLVDEYEGLEPYARNPQFSNRLENLIIREPEVYVVFAGTKKLEALQHKTALAPIVDTADNIKVSHLDKATTIELVTAPLTADGVSFEPGVADKVYDLTGGHPFYTQLLCQRIVEMTKDERRITIHHVDGAMESFLDNPSPHLILTWNELTDQQEIVGVGLAELCEERSSWFKARDLAKWLDDNRFPASMTEGQIDRTLASLADIDLIEKAPDAPPRYRFRMELVRRWIRANRSVAEMTDRYREAVLSRAGSIARQAGAWAIDVCVLALLLFVANELDAGFVACAVLVFAYFVVPMAFKQSTLGLRVAQLQAFGWNARPLARGHAVLYGCLMVGRLTTYMAPFGLLVSSVAESERRPWLFLTGLLIVDMILCVWDKRYRGFWERLGRTLLLRIEEEGR